MVHSRQQGKTMNKKLLSTFILSTVSLTSILANENYSNEHFQKLVDRIYESIGKVSSYIFGIPIGYILLINNFDFSGEQCFKNTSLLFLGIIFLILIWFVLFKNIDESIKSIEKDIDDFLGKIKNIKELEDIHQKLETLKSSELKKTLS